VAIKGFVHALPGICNAAANGWPLVVLSASCDSTQKTQGSFQETKQLEAASIYAKFAVRVEHMKRIPFHIEQAVRLRYNYIFFLSLSIYKCTFTIVMMKVCMDSQVPLM
jgi:hypothetical protein